MPPRPRKKARLSAQGDAVTVADSLHGADLADNIVASGATAHAISSVPLLQRNICQTVEIMYGLQHGLAAGGGVIDLDADMMSETGSSGPASISAATSALPEVDEHGRYPFAINDGGTFMTICQRAQANKSWLLTESAALLHAAGLLKDNDVEELREQFLTPQDLLPAAVSQCGPFRSFHS